MEDEPCDICGDIGYGELIITCSQCRISREHVYCKRIFSVEVTPEVWVCGICTGEDIVQPGHGGKEGHSSTQEIHNRGGQAGSPRKSYWSKAAGKVKYLPVEEAIRLSSGTLKECDFGRRRVGSKSHGYEINLVTASKCEQKPPVGPVKLHNFKGKKVTWVQPAAEVKTNKVVLPNKEVKTSEVVLPAKEVKAFSATVEKSMKVCAHSTSAYVQPVSGCNSFVEPGSPEIEESNLLCILPTLRLYRCFSPALHPVWKGGFMILNSASPTPAIFHDGFQAYPPSRVHHKVYEFALEMPGIIDVKLLPRDSVLGHLFQNDHPDFADIALYFHHADNVERSKCNHASLINLMEWKDSVMSSCIDGAELFIFTSKQLDKNSQDVIAGSKINPFLWGVFRDRRDDQIPHEIQEFPFSSPPPDCENRNDANTSCREVIDMEVDMMGGEYLGKVDVPVPKEPCRRDCGESTEETFYKGTETPKGINSSIPLSPPITTSKVTLNVAGSSKGSIGGAGGVIRDESGKWILGYTLNLRIQKRLGAELWALLQGLRLAWEKRFMEVLVESESDLVIEYLKSAPNALDPNRILGENCRNLIKREWKCKVDLVCKERNFHANWLATHFEGLPVGLTVFETPPSELLADLLLLQDE